MSELGPVSAELQKQLEREVREGGLLVWLDPHDHFTDFVQELGKRAGRGDFRHSVVGFRGSFLQTLLELEPFCNGPLPDKVLVHVPGYNETSITETPLLELYRAGKRHRKSLETLIGEAAAGEVLPRELEAFLADKPVTLAKADAWLSGDRAAPVADAFSTRLSALAPQHLLEELLTSSSWLVDGLKNKANRDALNEYLARHVGLPEDWGTTLGLGPVSAAHDVAYLAGSWLMGVEFSLDLREPAKTPALQAARKLPKPTLTVCRRLIQQLRDRHPEEYRQMAHACEDALDEERAHDPANLGSIDTFRFEERAIREAALSALKQGGWLRAREFAQERKPETCFWVRRDQDLADTWALMRAAAAVGCAIGEQATLLEGCQSLQEVADRYKNELHRVDRAHRRFEQLYHARYSTTLKDDVALRRVRDVVRRAYRDWADALSRQFADLCEKHGALPAADQRQRAIYESFVHPVLARGERVAVFLMDAMRFEMAAELVEQLADQRFRSELHVRYAELPTVTEVGMNALAPVATGDALRPVLADEGKRIDGLRSTGTFVVRNPETRVRAMASRSLQSKGISVELSEIAAAHDQELRNILRRQQSSPLLVVHSRLFDDAGEKGLHLITFEDTLRTLREVVLQLQRSGISNFVILSDHGFLLQDQTTQQQEYPASAKPKRRHVLSAQRSGMPDVLELPLSSLDYEADQELYLVFRRDTANWKVKEKTAPFVHGGNSLQERLVPVLVLEKKNRPGMSASKYEVVAKAKRAEHGRQQLELQVRLQQRSVGSLSFAGPKTISLALRVPGHDVAPEVIDVTPPGELDAGTLAIPVNADSVTVTFTLLGPVDDKVRVEVYHPDAIEQVTPKLVEGWFEVQSQGHTRQASAAETPPTQASEAWQSSIEDDGFRRVFELIDSQESVNEQELQAVLGSARAVRKFARHFDDLKLLVPFEVVIYSAGAMKTYKRVRDKGND